MISEPAGCPNASLEALAAGLPVIATDFGGAAEQVRNGHTGRLTPRGDAAAFAEAMVELAHDANLRRRLGAAARDLARTEFSMDRMAAEYRAMAGL
jgi:glycosyltransferase involved in cell wall biosynthesis